MYYNNIIYLYMAICRHLDQCSRAVEIRNMYNEDIVNTEKKIECVICLENMDLGQKIARLRCLCLYHKSCIDLWFNKNLWCPAHPPKL